MNREEIIKTSFCKYFPLIPTPCVVTLCHKYADGSDFGVCDVCHTWLGTEQTIERNLIAAQEQEDKLDIERKARAKAFARAHPLMTANKFKKALFTDTPCHADCWHATGDVCSCSCGGANHGIGCDPKSLRDMFD